MANDIIVLDTTDKIKAFRLLSLRSMLKLEAAGMKRRGPSALSIVKKETGIKARTAASALPLFEAILIAQGVLVR